MHYSFQIEDFLNDRVITFINRKLQLLNTRGLQDDEPKES